MTWWCWRSHTGRGIAPEELDLVWEELGRAQEARSVEGSGLGLPMVRAIIERHGGRAGLILAGEGSTVTLTLPPRGLRRTADCPPAATPADHRDTARSNSGDSPHHQPPG